MNILFFTYLLISLQSINVISFNYLTTNNKVIRKNRYQRDLKCFDQSLINPNGIELGLITVGTGLIMDNTISRDSLQKLKKDNLTLFNKGMIRSYKNLLFLGPIYYYLVTNNIGIDFIDYNEKFNYVDSLSIVFIHSIGYYFAHRNMHRNDFFKKYHYFHHQFNETLVPSIGNAVSETEFSFAYMFPFVVGSLLVNPNIDSFNFGIMIVSIMNLVIHCQELEDVKWNKFFVSPKTHLYHHQSKNNVSTYSAPTLNLEYIYKKIKDFVS